MTATLNDVSRKKPVEDSAEQRAAVELVRLAKEQGLSLTGPDGLLTQLTKTVLETALNEEMTEHLGYEKHDPAGAGSGNIRNGMRAAPQRRHTAETLSGQRRSQPERVGCSSAGTKSRGHLHRPDDPLRRE